MSPLLTFSTRVRTPCVTYVKRSLIGKVPKKKRKRKLCLLKQKQLLATRGGKRREICWRKKGSHKQKCSLVLVPNNTTRKVKLSVCVCVWLMEKLWLVCCMRRLLSHSNHLLHGASLLVCKCSSAVSRPTCLCPRQRVGSLHTAAGKEQKSGCCEVVVQGRQTWTRDEGKKGERGSD